MLSHAFATCSSPAGNEGDVWYTSLTHQMVYCNGTSWVAMGLSSAVNFGTLTSGDFCLASSGTTISCNTATIGESSLSQIAGLSVLGNGTNATGNVGVITGTASQVLVVNNAGTSLAFGAVNLGSSAAITGTLPITNGGTNIASQTANGVAYYNGTSIITGTGFVYSGGNVGIGTASPTTRLQVNDSTYGGTAMTVNASGGGENGIAATAGGGSGIAVSGSGGQTGVNGSGTSYGVSGSSSASFGSGVGNAGVVGSSYSVTGVYGSSNQAVGVYGTGVTGVEGVSTTSGGYAGYFSGTSGAYGLIIASGNVGIGTTGPGKSLTFYQQSSTDGIQFTGNSVGGTSSGTGFVWQLGYNVGGNKQFLFGNYDNIGSSSAGFLRMTSSGSVINLDEITANEATFVPLQLGDPGTPGGSAGSAVIVGNDGTTTNSSSNLWVNGNVAIGASYKTASASNGLVVQGTVGIGTTAPGAVLDVESSGSSCNTASDTLIKFGNAVGTGYIGMGGNGCYGGYIYIGTSTSLTSGIMINSGGTLLPLNGVGVSTGQNYGYMSDGYDYYQPSDAYGNGTISAVNSIQFDTYYTQQMVINSSGHLGIGTASPTAQLDVTGGYIRALDNGTNNAPSAGNGVEIVAVNGVGYLQAYNRSTSSYESLNITASNWSNSDRRLKTDIADLTTAEGLGGIEKLKPVSYRWRDVQNDEAQGRRLGLIAQDVEKVFPSLVTVNKAAPDTTITLADGNKEKITNALSVNYEGLITPLVKAVQELKADDDTKAAQIDELRAMIDRDNREIAELQKERHTH